MDEEKEKKPEGMSRDAFLESFVKLITDEYILPFSFVKRECNTENQGELPNKKTT